MSAFGSGWGAPWGMGYRDADEESVGDNTSGRLTSITDHEAQAKAALAPEYQQCPNIEGIVCAIAGQMQDAEYMFGATHFEELFNLDTAGGVWLDTIGAILDYPRQGWDDEEYRRRLKVWVMLLQYRGTKTRLIEIVQALTGVDTFTITTSPPKTYVLDIPTATLEELQSYVPFLEKCRPITYNGLINWDPGFKFVDAENRTTPPALVVTPEPERLYFDDAENRTTPPAIEPSSNRVFGGFITL